MRCLGANTAVEFLEGALPRDAAGEVEAHVAHCSECRRLLAEMAKSPSLLGSRPAPAEPDAVPPLRKGDMVGRFWVIDRVGEGGMGVVYVAHDPELDRRVAIKLLRGDDSDELHAKDGRARLVREAQAIAQLSHPNVINVYDVGIWNNQIYIAMEYVDGVTLTRWLREKRRRWPEVLEKFVAAGRALAIAHQTGLVHRDFKPDNVLVGADGRVRVMDFGLARSVFDDVAPPVTPSALGQSLTQSGAILGTPRYMAPEQLRGRRADARSDQYSFCVALHEGLFGAHPYDGDGTPEDVPGWLRRVVKRGLSEDPVDRFASMGTLLLAMERGARPTVRREVALVVALLLVGAGLFAYAREVTRELDVLRERVVAMESEIEVVSNAKVEVEDRLAREQAEHGFALSEERQRVLAAQAEVADREARLAVFEDKLKKKPKEKVLELDRATVEAIVKAHKAEVAGCYDDARLLEPELEGTVGTEFTVDETGHVLDVRVAGLRPGLDRCVERVLRGMSFPRATEGSGMVRARYPFTFRRYPL
jgi:predicted Ser/Thr protein kinase